jgi:ATP-dependent DNA helicase RecG
MTKQAATDSHALSDIDVTTLKGVGEQLRQTLAKLGVYSVQDLLFHLPLRYEDRTRLTPIGALRPNVEAVIEGEIRGCEIVYGRKRSLLCVLQDNTGLVSLRFYHFSKAQQQGLQTGLRCRCYGTVRRGAAGLEIYHPEYKVFANEAPPLRTTLTPIYPLTEGIGQNRLRQLTAQALALTTADNVPDLLSQVSQAGRSESLMHRLNYLHQPPRDADIDRLLSGDHPFQQQLAFEELLAHHLSLLRVKARNRILQAPALPANNQLKQKFLSQLSFMLTGAQTKVSAEIAEDLQQAHPMLRLLQGDVGSGKTLVAALAAVQAVANKSQVAVMAPTEILAHQHRVNFQQWFSPLQIEIAFLSGKQKTAERRQNLQAVATGEAQIIIGTHALIQNDVEFQHLGLVIIDEQHRFGVHQRLTLRNKGQHQNQYPHQLIMTATPIPRTLAMSVYADVDCSIIDELPPGRTPVATVLISDQRREQVIARVQQACQQGRQAYWVCTLIEESDVLEAQAAEEAAKLLQQQLQGLRIGLIHGRLKHTEKESAMSAFKQGEIDLLVATTVIEVGVDVPNASLMIIENPERLGLAQLHQLRGRVGRGSVASHCVLLYGSPLSHSAKARLQVMRQSHDGFIIAEKDLQLRGPGEVLGTRQTGEMQLKIADFQRHAHMLTKVRQTAESLKNTPVAAQLIRRWLTDKERYVNA